MSGSEIEKIERLCKCWIPPVSVLLVLRPLHGEQSRQNVDEDSPDPRSHHVGSWCPEMDVENNHSHANTEGVQDHCEEDEFAEERDDKGGGRDDLCQQEEEHGEGEEDGDGQ